ncbi:MULTISPECIES: DUF4190 domain-containing protein [Actinomadura]|uniref:DUF4190 domain-containing protein n=1 Tax=Actinomadura litoris TaxID=2678616 RepID=A0A7K1L0Y1_9ACTN|nr:MULTISPECIES: DUF4190 domain-containing protein [Actinomadura]MBT2206974.1 DUF4190 domain-containing protein [Actinomadura sp. NEAU-AAG7]MUN37925.1 DUF4190 domain-containing protein [Actinomadura litoris]
MAQPPYDPYGGYGSDPYGQHYQQPPVQHHYYGGGPPVVPRNNGMAVASMVLGIIGVLTCGGVVFSAAAVIFGHVAHGQIKRTGEAGGGMATTGLVLGYIFAVLGLLYWIVIVGFYGAAIWSINHDSSTY